MQVLSSWLAYIGVCLELPIGALVCSSFWYWIMVACFAFAVVMAIALPWSILVHRKKWRDALAAEAHRQAINHDEIAQRRWPGEAIEGGLRTDENGAVPYNPRP